MLTIPDVYYSTHGDHLLCVKLEGEIVIQLTYEDLNKPSRGKVQNDEIF